jgi:hypothetical protein
MAWSTSSKALTVAAIVMVGLFAVADLFGLRTTEDEPRTWAIRLDTAAVIAIRFTDEADPDGAFALSRLPQGWQRQPAWTGQGRRWTDTLPPDAQAAALLRTFERIPVKRDMGMIKLVGSRFGLAEGQRCTIAFEQADGTSQALDLGATTFAPGKAGAWTYVRVPEAPQVYAVEGLLTGDLRLPAP